MVLTEFRICLPMDVHEFQVAQLYMVVKASKDNTKGGEGVEWIKNEPYDNTDGHWGVSAISGIAAPVNKGQYTLKHYHIASRIPGVVRSMLPTDAMILVEEAWNAYPHCVTVLTNAYLDKEKFRIVIETMHAPDNGTQENALSLSADDLARRKVEVLDILDVDRTKPEFKPELDPATYHSEKTGRGPLAKGWQSSTTPIMCCYKLVTINFKYFGLQTRIEGGIEGSQRDLFKLTLGQAHCLTDEWFGLTMEDIRRLEQESKDTLNSALDSKAAAGDSAGAAAGSAAAAPAADASTAETAAAAPAAAPA